MLFLITARRNGVELHVAEVHDPIGRNGDHVQEVHRQNPVDLPRHELRRDTRNIAKRNEQNELPARARGRSSLRRFDV